MIQAIAIDDEPLALEVILKLSEKVPFLQVNKVFTNAFNAMEYMQTEKVDLLFLDIKMPDISGIDFYYSLHIRPLVIFTTAYAEHAVAGFDLDAVDYLLKPFSTTRFLKACNKAKEMLLLRSDKAEKDTSIVLKSGTEQIRIRFSDICYLEATGNYVTFATKNHTLVSRLTLTECMDLLPTRTFVRIHRSFIINKDAIDKLERHQVTVQGYVLPIANAYKNAIIL